MRPFRVPITMRRLTIVIVVVALVFKGLLISRWWQTRQMMWEMECGLHAYGHRISEMRYRGEEVGEWNCRGPFIPPFRYQTDTKLEAYHARQRRKWELAASRPWWAPGTVDGDNIDKPTDLHNPPGPR